MTQRVSNMADEEMVYASVRWLPEDVQALRPEWSLEQCAEWLDNNSRHIEDRLVELGWDVINDLLPSK